MEIITILPEKRQRYDITERKKAELDFLTIQVLDVQHQVEQYQAMVTSLTEKSDKFQAFLATAEQKRDQSRSNKDLLDEVVQAAKDLQKESSVAYGEMATAKSKVMVVTGEMRQLIDDLIYSAEVINKLSNILIRKKDKNPLISDELMTVMDTAGKDANTAVALTLVALKSAFASQASNLESEAAGALEYKQSVKLYDVLTGKYTSFNASNPKEQQRVPKQVFSLKALIDMAYARAKQDYLDAQKAEQITVKQLDDANSLLNKSQIQLASLQAGLAAANAAALAS